MLTYLLDAFAGPGAGFMYTLTAVGAFALAIALERAFWLFARWRPDVDGVTAALEAGDAERARTAAGDTPLGDVVRAGVAQQDAEAAWEAMGSAAADAEEALRARVAYLATVSSLATMLGLLGTVYGLVLAFSALGDTASGENAVRLAEGVSTAMATTGAGLIVGIASQALFAVLDARVRSQLSAIEATAGRIALMLRKG